jgi:glycine/D-amino acid oxidase-like deaminating enzyme
VEEGVKLVHNYGHGGSGWTVFCGAAREAASLLGYKS